MLDKCRKAQIVILLLLSYPLSAQEKNMALQQYEELEHVHRGCPENSQCDEKMGQLLAQYLQTLKDLQLKKDSKQAEDGLRELVARSGWPAEFYVSDSTAQTFGPVTTASRCPFHGKLTSGGLNKGRAFLRGSENNHALFVKGDTSYRLKMDEGLVLATAQLYPTQGTPQSFRIPLGERPLYLLQGRLMVLAELEDNYVLLSIPTEGFWSAQFAPSELTSYLEAQDEVPCPAQASTPPVGFTKSICRRITDDALRPVGVLQVFWDCQ